jgi:hypothetical protein
LDEFKFKIDFLLSSFHAGRSYGITRMILEANQVQVAIVVSSAEKHCAFAAISLSSSSALHEGIQIHPMPR